MLTDRADRTSRGEHGRRDSQGRPTDWKTESAHRSPCRSAASPTEHRTGTTPVERDWRGPADERQTCAVRLGLQRHPESAECTHLEASAYTRARTRTRFRRSAETIRRVHSSVGVPFL